ncbi:hypothetical protein NC981_09220 [Leptolyngbya sp. DQ-M1]|uniref:hypothetical protein n=1 Tax=Leptolyngbya sp. DQ-M1 TaxID=2933920 RepID=UPI0032981EEA
MSSRWTNLSTQLNQSLVTSLHNKGVPIKTIASITGHESLNEFSRYLEMTPEQRRSTIMQLL